MPMPMGLSNLMNRAKQGDPSAIEMLQELGYGPDGQQMGPPGGMPPGGGGPPGMGGGPPMDPGMGAGGPPPGAGGMPPPGGGGMPPNPGLIQRAMQMAQGLRR